MKTPALTARYHAYLNKLMSGDDYQRQMHFMKSIQWLTVEYERELLLTRPEAVALAKKLLSRALDCECTRAEVEAFLRG